MDLFCTSRSAGTCKSDMGRGGDLQRAYLNDATFVVVNKECLDASPCYHAIIIYYANHSFRHLVASTSYIGELIRLANLMNINVDLNGKTEHHFSIESTPSSTHCGYSHCKIL